jgi:hypothetical protein
MSRFFSSTTKVAKKLEWNLNGTTKVPKSQLERVETALDKVPELAVIVHKASVK